MIAHMSARGPTRTEFRQLQKRRMPQLGRGQFLDLFHTWRDRYLARLEAELAAMRKRMAANDAELRQLIAEQRKRNGQADDVFICKCGEVIADPFEQEDA